MKHTLIHQPQRAVKAWRTRPVLTVCLGALSLIACDPDSEQTDDIEALELDTHEQQLELEHSGLAESRPTEERHEHEDDCGFGSYISPVEIRWTTPASGLPELSVAFALEYGPADSVELRFWGAPMPAQRGSVEIGDAISVHADALVPMPAELVELVHGGEPYAVFAVLDACKADAPEQPCERRHSGMLYLEDGVPRTAEQHQDYMRQKWSARKPWLFESGVVTNVVDMKGQ